MCGTEQATEVAVRDLPEASALSAAGEKTCGARLSARVGSWNLADVGAPEGYRAALAVAGREWTLQYCR